MNGIPIYFQFNEKKPALLALDTLQELGYEVEWLTHDHLEHKPTLMLTVDHCDLTSALEIAQAHGGILIEARQSPAEHEVLTSAYSLEDVTIPAHVVVDAEQFDPAENEYDHFPAGVHL
jgi:hypothetical protein